MSCALTELQGAFVDRIKRTFKMKNGRSFLKKVEAIEIPFDLKSTEQFSAVPPAVYVLPTIVLGTEMRATFTTRWAFYAVSNRATSKARTTGSDEALGIGSYAIAMRTAATLQHWVPGVANANTIEVEGIENLTGLAFAQQRYNVWAVTVRCDIGIDLEMPDARLEEFLTFDADIDLEPFEDPIPRPPAEVDANLTVELRE